MTHDYTDFGTFEVDKECESPYYKHHRTLIDFINNGTGERTQVAKAIRPMLEGYLHRRFPGLISRGLMFGDILTSINSATTPNPLVFAKPLVGELQEINTYAGKFHHDTNPDGSETTTTTSDEVKQYSKRALAVVYGELP
jgi:wobble nucleotide-excising tRNase